MTLRFFVAQKSGRDVPRRRSLLKRNSSDNKFGTANLSFFVDSAHKIRMANVVRAASNPASLKLTVP
jgi:hypothetical protein